MQENSKISPQISKQDLARYDELCVMALNFAKSDESDTLARMIDSGLPVNLKDTKGNTLLMLSSYNGNFKTTKMLLSKGAKVDERNDKFQTPLAGAAFKGYLDIVKLLVQNGADTNADNGLGMTPLSFAMMFGRKDVVKYLSKFTKKPNLLIRVWFMVLGLFKK